MPAATHGDLTDDDAVVHHRNGHGPGQREIGDTALKPGDPAFGGQLPGGEQLSPGIGDDHLRDVLVVGNGCNCLVCRDAVAEHERRLDRIAERTGQQVQVVAGIRAQRDHGDDDQRYGGHRNRDEGEAQMRATQHALQRRARHA